MHNIDGPGVKLEEAGLPLTGQRPVQQAVQVTQGLAAKTNYEIPPPTLGDFPVLGTRLAISKWSGKFIAGAGIIYSLAISPLWTIDSFFMLFGAAYAAGFLALGAGIYITSSRRVSALTSMLRGINQGGSTSQWIYWASRSQYRTQKEQIAATLENHLQAQKYIAVLRGQNKVTAINRWATMEINLYDLPNSATCVDILASGFGLKGKGEDLLARLGK